MTVLLWIIGILVIATALVYLGRVSHRPDCICGQWDRTECVLCPGCGRALHVPGCWGAGDCGLSI